MVGGPVHVMETCRPLFNAFSAHVVHLGPAGSGQTAKLFNNMLMILNLTSIEAVSAPAESAGLDVVKLL